MLRAVTFASVLFCLTAHAMEPVEVGETRFANAALTVVTDDGVNRYGPAELEQFGTYALETITPWREETAEFIGARLQDLLSAHGLHNAPAIRVIAENDYAVTIPRRSWTEHDALVATRVDGKGHTRRARGPIQFVFNMSADPIVGRKDFESNWVWMAARIESVAQ